MNGLPEPPWTYSPKEVNEWINSVYGKHKCKKSKMERRKEWLKNIELDIDLDVEKEIKEPKSIILKAIEKVVGYEKMEENFELMPTTEILLKALSKAGFKKIKIDGHEYEERKIKNFMEFMAKKMSKKVKEVKIVAMNDGDAYIRISKLHNKNKHSIEIKIDKIREKDLQAFLTYIRKRLKEKDEVRLK
ncbi:MAG: hypothetical protein J7J36_00830 [Thermoplasmata archaeon]|nr:hypothetical protein [Thermoplasmata archaeon]